MKFLKKHYQLFFVVFIILLGGYLRFYNANWDNYQVFHPDERNIDNAVTKINFVSQLDPDFFAYGGLPIYLYKVSGEMMNTVYQTSVWTSDWGHINQIGRTFSAFFSTLTILVIFLLGKKVFNKITGIIASFIFTFTVSSIQIAHFATTESFIILIVTLLTYLSLCYYEKPRSFLLAALAVTSGLGIAAKTTALSFLMIPFLSLLLIDFKTKGKNIISFIFKPVFFFALTITIFFLFSPYTFLSYHKFLQSMNYETGVATGRVIVPYTHQFDKTISYLYELYNLFWQMGPVFALSLLGLGFVLYFTFKKRKASYLFILIFPIIYFLYAASWHAKFIRYMTPLLPFFSLYAAFALSIFIKRYKILGRIILFIFLTTSAIWALSYMSVYSKPQTRYTASLWMLENIKSGELVLTEHWDDGLPIYIPGKNMFFKTEQLTIYDNEFNNKAEYLANMLASADYISLTTRRLHGSLIYLTENYPVTSRYYRYLFAEKLGYTKVAEFSSYPSFLGIEINDDASEESFQVYDHPKIIIFKNTKHLSYEELNRIISANN
ncbi:MAG: glycosyltransferase family 39 protein [Candidatus Levybacteria bacterium]|nr:glycosyltransferase family 39 protein [Candidatus Levybacteria bacterium]MBP9814755.1 glycosyltransferase family 39 protein [Candidatus Levybacteria bacterium]